MVKRNWGKWFMYGVLGLLGIGAVATLSKSTSAQQSPTGNNQIAATQPSTDNGSTSTSVPLFTSQPIGSTFANNESITLQAPNGSRKTFIMSIRDTSALITALDGTPVTVLEVLTNQNVPTDSNIATAYSWLSNNGYNIA